MKRDYQKIIVLTTETILEEVEELIKNSCVIETCLSDFHKMTITDEDDLSEVKTKIDLLPRLQCFPMINLEKNFCPNYLWKTAT